MAIWGHNCLCRNLIGLCLLGRTLVAALAALAVAPLRFLFDGDLSDWKSDGHNYISHNYISHNYIAITM